MIQDLVKGDNMEEVIQVEKLRMNLKVIIIIIREGILEVEKEDN